MKSRRTVAVSDNVCLNASCVCLFEDASVGYPILPVDTEDSSEYALLELFEHFNMATVGDPCLTAITTAVPAWKVEMVSGICTQCK